MKRLIPLLLLLASTVYGQGIPVKNLFGNGPPNANLAFVVGTTYVDQSTSPATVYTCTSVTLTATLSQCTWTSSGGITSVSSPIKLVQTPGTFTSFSSVTTSPIAYSSANTSCNLLLAFVQMGNTSSGNTVSLSDTQGNTWLIAGTSDIGISYIFYVPCAKAGANTVTASFNASSSGSWAIAEYSGHLVAHPIGASNNPNGTSPPSYAIYDAVPNSALIAIISNNGVANSYSNFVGCNPRSPTTSVTSVWCDNTSISTGVFSYSFAQSLAGSPDTIVHAITILPSTYVASTTTPAVVRVAEGGVATSGAIKPLAASPLTEVFGGGNQAGDTIVLLTWQSGSTDNITSVTDTNGNLYTKLAGGGAIANNTSFNTYAIYTAPIAATTLVNNTITVAMSAGSGTLAAMEVSGISGVEDANATGTSSYNLVTSNGLNKFIVTSNAMNAGFNWNLLSGTDLFGTVGPQFEVNVFNSCAKTNPISSFVNTTGSFAGSFSVALTPTTTVAACPALNGSQNNNTTTASHQVIGIGTGTASPSATLGLYGLGQQVTPTFTSTVTAAGVSFTNNAQIMGISVTWGTTGVNASSGAVTVLKNGVALNPSMTLTIGTSATGASVDFAHPFWVIPGDVVSVQVTTQAAETLANVKVVLTVIP